NAYPAEQYTFVTTDPISGAQTSRVITTTPHASAAQTASMLNSLPGVSANAFTSANLTDLSLTSASVLQINGQSFSFSGDNVPDPITSPVEFEEYLVAQINSNPELNSLGVRAVLGGNSIDPNARELRLVASSGVDLKIGLSGDGS